MQVLTNIWHYPGVSYACTSPSLSNAVSYPYFLRTTLPDSNVVAVYAFTKGLAIKSLVMYASFCRYFVCVAPPCPHQSARDDEGRPVVCDVGSYHARFWRTV